MARPAFHDLHGRQKKAAEAVRRFDLSQPEERDALVTFLKAESGDLRKGWR